MQSSKTLFAVIGLSLSIAACGDTASMDVDNSPREEGALKSMELTVAVWDASAHEHAAAEIAKLALHRSKNVDVLAWAKNSMAAHQEQYTALRSLAESKGLKAAKIMTIDGEKQYAKLFVLGSNSFDAKFKQVQAKLQPQGTGYANALSDVTSDVQLRTWATQSNELWMHETQTASTLP